jgi:putative salt-induced outer membrane protein YdiY
MLWVVSYSAAIDQLYLANGDRLSGKIQIDGDDVTISSEVLGTVKVPRKAITTMVLDAPSAIDVGEHTFVATTIAYDNGTASIYGSRGLETSVPSALIRSSAFVALPSKVPSKYFPSWGASLEAGFTTARGNTSINNLHFAVTTTQTTDRHRLNLSFASLLAESGAGKQETSASIFHSGARYEFNLSDKEFAFGLLTLDSDQHQRLDLRSVAGAGLGRRITDASATTFDVFTGATFNREDFSTYPDRVSGEFLGGQELTYRFSSRSSVTERLVLFPNLSRVGDFRLTFESLALMKLNQWLGWESRLSDFYVSNPASFARSNDVIITTGIRLTYGHEEHKFRPRSKIAPLTN